ncbi:oxidoreductase family, NAD-binding rossmann fold protein [Rhizoctonia solani]|uniref:D-xylose 1-dehydrogenase (NADP(+), D-xylono-1,5-lactone-forming) n=1 Tax=Rhizoctonia solani TaxID=456999 RepID=A0A8H8NRV4_9AGAM|nr:oxidoreductase family, NAD-binding rossmann fold protein [Rhizoctonia solani]QRW18871.1 oxidoreductase family, NAD-binding rossmann fold protein [Rhizoctonia solani]
MSKTSGIYTLRWGIVATGNMAKQFVEDLLLDPSTRGVNDIRHVVHAVSSSSGVGRANQFIKSVIGESSTAVAYDSVAELVNDPEVDVVYIASITSAHYTNVKTCLEAKKPVLCEKSFTINAAQTAALISLSKNNTTFLAEALWTRYFPITSHIHSLLHVQHVLGKIYRVTSDLSLDFAANLPKHGIRDPLVGGGALLAIGVYPLTWVMLALYEGGKERELPEVVAQMVMQEVDEAKGVHEVADEQTNASLVFKKSRATAGQLTIPWSPHRPESYTLEIYKTKASPASTETKEFPIPGKGLFFQADAVARALREGKIEADEYRLEDSLALMQVLDEVRKQGGLKYRPELEAY